MSERLRAAHHNMHVRDLNADVDPPDLQGVELPKLALDIRMSAWIAFGMLKLGTFDFDNGRNWMLYSLPVNNPPDAEIKSNCRQILLVANKLHSGDKFPSIRLISDEQFPTGLYETSHLVKDFMLQADDEANYRVGTYDKLLVTPATSNMPYFIVNGGRLMIGNSEDGMIMQPMHRKGSMNIYDPDQPRPLHPFGIPVNGYDQFDALTSGAAMMKELSNLYPTSYGNN